MKGRAKHGLCPAMGMPSGVLDSCLDALGGLFDVPADAADGIGARCYCHCKGDQYHR